VYDSSPSYYLLWICMTVYLLTSYLLTSWSRVLLE
jgi:hypothetical protein